MIAVAWWLWCATAPPGSARWSAGWLTFIAWTAWHAYRVLEAKRVAELRARWAVAEAIEAREALDAVLAAVAPWLVADGHGTGAQSAVERNRDAGSPVPLRVPVRDDREDRS